METWMSSISDPDNCVWIWECKRRLEIGSSLLLETFIFSYLPPFCWAQERLDYLVCSKLYVPSAPLLPTFYHSLDSDSAGHTVVPFHYTALSFLFLFIASFRDDEKLRARSLRDENERNGKEVWRIEVSMDPMHMTRASLRKPQSGLNDDFDISKYEDADHLKAIGVVRNANRTGHSYDRIDRPVRTWLRTAPDSAQPLLDLGCGFGFQTKAALRVGRNVVCVDMASEHIDHVRQFYVSSPMQLPGRLVSAYVSTFPGISFAPGSFCAALLSEVIHLMPGADTLRLFRDVFDWLIPGGRLVLTAATPPTFDPFERAGAKYSFRSTATEIWDFLYDEQNDDETIVVSSPFQGNLTTLPAPLRVSAPDTVYSISTIQLLSLCRLTGFLVETLEYMAPDEKDGLPEEFSKVDERVLLVARKPAQDRA